MLEAVAFDLDGTLYPNLNFYVYIIPFILKELKFLSAFGRARNIVRSRREEYEDFYTAQAQETAKLLNLGDSSIGTTREKIEREIYRGWEPHFKNVKLFPYMKKMLYFLKERRLRVGLLSDFPYKRKIVNLGLEGFWDAALCSEEVGVLKPGSKPFLLLADRLGVRPEQTLYVGNSVRYDVQGAQRAGMKTALKTSFLQTAASALRQKSTDANFVFYDYRQLCDYVVKLTT
ncbi:MAG: HAD family hydrolase [Treponema sp.]|jgi:putative hydrolase of the HAD superfamily|nr:HAD family hydrolase [Treponema sp.]